MSGYPWGGSEELWSQSAVRLHELGHEVVASVAGWPKLSHRVTALPQRGIKLQVRRSGQSSTMRRIFKYARRMVQMEARDLHWIRLQKPDLVVISQGGILDGLDWLQFCLSARLPFVVICQCNAEAWWPTDSEATQMLAAFQAAKQLFFVSQANLALLDRQLGGTLSNAMVVRNPFNVPPRPSLSVADRNGCLAFSLRGSIGSICQRARPIISGTCTTGLAEAFGRSEPIWNRPVRTGSSASGWAFTIAPSSFSWPRR